jgi:WD40 repeat protein
MVLWDAENGDEIRRFEETRGLWSLGVLTDGSRVLTGGGDDGSGSMRLRVWDVESGRELRRLIGHLDDVLSVAPSPYGRLALSGGKDRTSRLWDLENGQELHQEVHTSAVFGVAFAPDGARAASCDGHGFIRIWDLSGTEARVRPLPRWHGDAVYSVAFSPDAKLLASAGRDGRVILWDSVGGEKRREWRFPGNVQGLAFAPDGRHLALVNGNGTVYLLRLAKPDPTTTLEPERAVQNVNSL